MDFDIIRIRFLFRRTSEGESEEEVRYTDGVCKKTGDKKGKALLAVVNLAVDWFLHTESVMEVNEQLVSKAYERAKELFSELPDKVIVDKTEINTKDLFAAAIDAATGKVKDYAFDLTEEFTLERDLLGGYILGASSGGFAADYLRKKYSKEKWLLQWQDNMESIFGYAVSSSR